MPERLPERLTPLAARHSVRAYYGDIHNHCALSYGHGTLDSALKRARLQLDFVSITGHAHWPDMPVNEPSVAHIVDFHEKGFAKLRAGWSDHFKTLRAHNDDERFVVLPGYEIHSCADGDYTIVYADLVPDALVLADSPEALKAALRDKKGGRAFAFPHHIGYRRGARGINWDSFDPELSPFVEMFSMHGCAESSQSARGYLHSMGPVDGASTMAEGLARGARFGIVGNTDHHSGFPGSYGHGRMAVYGREGGREEIWAGLCGRHTNALTGDNTHLLIAVGDAIQGDIAPLSTRACLDVEAVAGGFIDMIDIVKNGTLFARMSPDMNPQPVAGGNGLLETILTLELGWGARGSCHRWEGSVAIEGGRIEAVEPRFRGPEIVSPLEGGDNAHPLPQISTTDDAVHFAVTAEANPNNVTPATQGLALRIVATADAEVHANLSGASLRIPIARLLRGALSGNLGPIDTPAYRFHMLPRAHQWQWRGTCDLGETHDGDTVYARLTQRDGQMAWSSPIHFRSAGR
ncbi:MAG: hypothetical protein AAFW98_01875 [Pseudomonadota bacterium]